MLTHAWASDNHSFCWMIHQPTCLLLAPFFTITDPHKPVASASAWNPYWSDFGAVACSSENHSHLGSALLLSTSNLVTVWSEPNWPVLWNAIWLGEELCPPLVVCLSDTLLFSACLAHHYITPITYRELWCLEAAGLVAGWAYGVSTRNATLPGQSIASTYIKTPRDIGWLVS